MRPKNLNNHSRSINTRQCREDYQRKNKTRQINNYQYLRLANKVEKYIINIQAAVNLYKGQCRRNNNKKKRNLWAFIYTWNILYTET
jgi:hypothetical protein